MTKKKAAKKPAPKPKRSHASVGRHSRNKGKAFERELAHAFRAVFPNVQRTLTQARDSGEAPDIDVPGFWVEGKHHKKVPIRKAYEQAVEELQRHQEAMSQRTTDDWVRPPRVPIAVTKDNGKEPLVTLSLEHFLAMQHELRGRREARIAQQESAAKVEVPVFKMAQPRRDHRDRPDGLDDGTV